MSEVGIVYQIKCNKTGEIYFGSTIQSLEDRIKAHINDIKTYENGNAVGVCVSSLIIKRGDYTESVVKELEFDDPDDLLWEERWAIEACDKAINIKKPILTEEERDELNKQCKRNYSKNFYHKNPELCKERNKEYHQTEKGKESKARRDKKYRNGPKREELLEKQRERSKANYDPEKSKAYREGEKREELLEKKREQYQKAKAEGKCDSIQCDCGGTYRFLGKARHFKTKKHQEYEKST